MLEEGSGAPGGTSVLLDAATGAREERAFLGAGPERIFSTMHLPPGDAVGGLVVCSPLHNEFLKHYRREVLLSRHLAGHGVAVSRFHYRGTGNSDGDEADMTFDRMCEDAKAAASSLLAFIGPKPLAFLGTRFGALVAAAAGAGPLVLWEPVVEPKRYFREAFRIRRMSDVASGKPADDSLDPRRDLETEGHVEVLGAAFHRRLYESSLDHSLADLVPAGTPVLILRFGAPDRAQLQQVLEAKGAAAETRFVAEHESWWFFDGWRPASPALSTLIDLTREWLIRAMAGRG